MLCFRMLKDILRDDVYGLVCRSLIKFITESRSVKTVDPQICGIGNERTSWKARDELFEIGFGRVIILVLIIAQAPILSDGIITFRTVGEH